MAVQYDHHLMSLRDVRKLLHYGADELAKRLAISTGAYLRHERGERRIFHDKVIVLARTMDVSMDLFSRPLTVEERQTLIVKGEPRRQMLERQRALGPDSQYEVEGDDGMPEAEPASEAKPSLDELLADWAEDPA